MRHPNQRPGSETTWMCRSHEKPGNSLSPDFLSHQHGRTPFVSCDERLAQAPGDRPPPANRGVAGAEPYRAGSVIPSGPSFPTSAAPNAETPVGARSAPHPSAAPSRIALPSWRRTGAPRDRGRRGGHERLLSSWLDQSSTAPHRAQSARRVNRKIVLTELFLRDRVVEREAPSLIGSSSRRSDGRRKGAHTVGGV